MDIRLGAKNPKKEITLGKTGSYIFIIVFFSLMLLLSYYLVNTFIIEDKDRFVFIKCVDGTVEKLTEGVYTYCGDYVGGDTKQSIIEYAENLNKDNIDIGINDNQFIINEE